MKPYVKQLVKTFKGIAQRSKTMIIAYHIYDNRRIKKRFSSGKKESCSHTPHPEKSPSEGLSYIQQVFDDYLTYSGISLSLLREKRILEIGPGDNIGVALKFLLAGAKQVVCLDKFSSSPDARQRPEFCRAMRERLNDKERNIYDSIINLDGDNITLNSKKLSPVYGIGIEEAEKILEPSSFDLIVSRAVLEHIGDPDAAFSVMNKLLKSPGYMIHKIDFRDHGLFSGKGFHPLTYLTIPDSLYKLMTYDSGKPNRRLLPYYREKMAELGYESRILITQIAGSDIETVPPKETLLYGVDYSDATISLIEKIRPRLRSSFQDMSDGELMVQGIFLIARKPHGEALFREKQPIQAFESIRLIS